MAEVTVARGLRYFLCIFIARVLNKQVTKAELARGWCGFDVSYCSFSL
jgi:hypothetical protein